MRSGMKTFVMEEDGSGGYAGIIGVVIGVIVVPGLIAAFVFGARRKEKEPAPTVPVLGRQPDDPDAQAPGQAPEPAPGLTSLTRHRA
jgi:hypothetical protein